MFQHLASLNATAAAPFPPERTAWLVTLPLIVIDHAQGQGYMYGPKPTPGLGGEYSPALYNPAAFVRSTLEDVAQANEIVTSEFYERRIERRCLASPPRLRERRSPWPTSDVVRCR